MILVQQFGKLTDGSVCSCLYAEDYIDNEAPWLSVDIEFVQSLICILNDLNEDGLILAFKSAQLITVAEIGKNGM